MKNLKFESIDLFNASIVEGDKIMGGYGDTTVSTYITTANPAPEHTDGTTSDTSPWT